MSKRIKLMLVSITLAMLLALVSSTVVTGFAVPMFDVSSAAIEIAGRGSGSGSFS